MDGNDHGPPRTWLSSTHMDRDTLIYLLRGDHIGMPERLARGIWPHPPLAVSQLVTLITDCLAEEEWFPRPWEPAQAGQYVHEGGTIQRAGPHRFIYRTQRHAATDPIILAESAERVFSTAEKAARHYLRWDLNLPGKLDSWTVLDR
jgi:hypothetical protein